MKRWPLHKTYFWETAPFFRLLLPVIAGIISYSYGLVKNQLSINTALTMATLAFSIYLIITFLRQRKLQNALTFILINISLFFIAWSLCWFNDIKNSASWFGNTVGKSCAYLARITSTPAEKEKTWKLEVCILNSLTGTKVATAKGNAFIYVYKDLAGFPFHQGDTILMPDKWKAIKNSGNPFEFDYAAYCARNNLSYQQFLSQSDIHLYAKADDKAKCQY